MSALGEYSNRVAKKHPWLISLALSVGIAFVDYATGTRLRLFPLYFIPLAIVAGARSRKQAIGAAGALTAMWAISNFDPHALPIWAANAASQFAAFGFVAWLVNVHKARADLHKELASTDALTGLLNSRAFIAAAERELARQRRLKSALTMAYLDVDDFKAVNSILGHLGADEVLRQSSQAMRRALRSTDIIGRVGGDEFAILLPDSNPEQVQGVLDRLRREALAANQGLKVAITVSVGAIVFVEPAESVNAMLEESDELMYSVKGQAKDAARVRLASAVN